MNCAVVERVKGMGFGAVARVTYLFIAGAACSLENLRAADDVLVPDRDAIRPAVVRRRMVVGPGQIVVLPGGGNFDQIVERQKRDFMEKLDAKRQSTIADIDQICHLTAGQKWKLEMAGQRDQARLMDLVESVRQEQQQQRQNFAGQFVPLRNDLMIRAENGALFPDSFFIKLLPHTLTPEQIALLREFRQSHLSRSISAAINDIDRIAKLNDEQKLAIKEKLIEFNLYSSPFSKSEVLSSLSERLVMLYQLAMHADDEIKPLLTSEQWRRLVVPLKKFKAYEAELKTRGLIASREPDESNGDNSESVSDATK